MIEYITRYRKTKPIPGNKKTNTLEKHDRWPPASPLPHNFQTIPEY